MADIQPQLTQYDDVIKLKRFDENQMLREKRDIILDKLREKLGALRIDDKSVPTFDSFNQGSYAMGTGIDPVDRDYDIDVGIAFNAPKSAYSDPVALKALVKQALDNHTDLGTVIRQSCVTVRYKRNGELAFHVDLAIYAYDDIDTKTAMCLAKGKASSASAERFWEEADPKGLIRLIDERFSGSDHLQFLRVIRLLKGWKSHVFPQAGSAAPVGIGLTVASYERFSPHTTQDAVSLKTSFDDRAALLHVVEGMISSFVFQAGPGGEYAVRLRVNNLVRPSNDLFSKMSNEQMGRFKSELEGLRDQLKASIAEEDATKACGDLRKVFGNRFPVPLKKDTGTPGGRAITGSGVSA